MCLCPHCCFDRSKVLETRRSGGLIYRQRECLDAECSKRFVSREDAPPKLRMPQEITESFLARMRKATAARQNTQSKRTPREQSRT